MTTLKRRLAVLEGPNSGNPLRLWSDERLGIESARLFAELRLAGQFLDSKWDPLALDECSDEGLLQAFIAHLSADLGERVWQ